MNFSESHATEFHFAELHNNSSIDTQMVLAGSYSLDAIIETNKEPVGSNLDNTLDQLLLYRINTRGIDDMLAGGLIVISGGLSSDMILGSAKNDRIRGDGNSRSSGGADGGDDLLFGGLGNDWLGGKGGNDSLFGGAGKDNLFGDNGDDLLFGGKDDDVLTGDDYSGGTGSDFFVLERGAGTDTITDFGNGDDKILLRGIDFSEISITIYGNDSLIELEQQSLAIVKGVTDLIADDFVTLPKILDPVPVDFSPENQPAVALLDTGVNIGNPNFAGGSIFSLRDYTDGDDNSFFNSGEGNEHGTHTGGVVYEINSQAHFFVGRVAGSGQWADAINEFLNRYYDESTQPNPIIKIGFDLAQKNADGTVSTRYGPLTNYERATLAHARQRGAIIVVPAGNEGGVMSTLGQAAQEFDNIITVGSVDGNIRADYSNYGPGLVLVADGGTISNPIGSTVGEGRGAMAGTSVAAAVVTGQISLIWAANPDLNYLQVIDIARDTARDVGTPGWDEETGAGVVDLETAIRRAQETEPETYTPPAIDVASGFEFADDIIPLERPVSFNYPITFERFTGTVAPIGEPYNGVAYRNSPSLNDRVGPGQAAPSKAVLTFDAWTYGQSVSDWWLGTEDALWYRIEGTEYWVPSGWIYGYPDSRPNVLPPAPPALNPDDGTQTPVVSIPIDSSSINYRTGSVNPYAYNPALIGQCTWFAYGRMQETGLLPSGAYENGWFRSHAESWRRDAERAGLQVNSTPTAGTRGLVVWPPGIQGGHSKYGHVAFLEEVLADGSIRISEANWAGQGINERILTPEQQSGLAFIPLENAGVGSEPQFSSPIARPGAQREHRIREGETLSGLASRYLGDANRWKEITRADGSTYTEAEARNLQIGESVYLPVEYQQPLIPPTDSLSPPSSEPQILWPSAEPVLKYMADELSNNSVSPTVKALQFLNTASWLAAIPIISTIAGSTAVKAVAYVLWADKVRLNGDWDHKTDVLDKTNGSQKWVRDESTGNHYQYESWSNMHYGYVGKIAKFSDFELLQGAGLAQTLTNGIGSLPSKILDVVNKLRKNPQNLLLIFDFVNIAISAYNVVYGSNSEANIFDPSSIDDPKDQKAILDGMRLAQKYPNSISEAEFLDDIRSESKLHEAYGNAPA